MDWTDIAGPITDLGVTGALIFALWLILVRRIITKGAHDEVIASLEREHATAVEQLKAQLQYVEERRREERQGRLDAEARVKDFTERWDHSLQLLGTIERELLSRGRQS